MGWNGSPLYKEVIKQKISSKLKIFDNSQSILEKKDPPSNILLFRRFAANFMLDFGFNLLFAISHWLLDLNKISPPKKARGKKEDSFF